MADERTPKLEIKVDLSGWTTMKPIMAWNQAAQKGDFIGMALIMVEVVKQLPDGQPITLETFENMTPALFEEVGRTVGAAVTTFFRK